MPIAKINRPRRARRGRIPVPRLQVHSVPSLQIVDGSSLLVLSEPIPGVKDSVKALEETTNATVTLNWVTDSTAVALMGGNPLAPGLLVLIWDEQGVCRTRSGGLLLAKSITLE